MFPSCNDNAFQTTLNSINESTMITIDYINQEVKVKKDSHKENKIRGGSIVEWLSIDNGEDGTNHLFFKLYRISLVHKPVCGLGLRLPWLI